MKIKQIIMLFSVVFYYGTCAAQLPQVPIILDPCASLGDRLGSWEGLTNVLSSRCTDVRVGIGTTSPSHGLHVVTDARFNQAKIDFNQGIGAEPKGFSKLFIKNTNQDASIEIDQAGNNKLYQKLLFFQYSNPTTEILKAHNTLTGITTHLLESNGRMIINNGTVDIFHLEPSGRLTIQNNTKKIFQLENTGLLRVRNVRVDTETWADYVFKAGYKLMPLYEVECFINEKGHLPNIPSEQEIITDGIDVAEMNRLLLEKIEELTLYLINQDKQIVELKKQIAILNEK